MDDPLEVFTESLQEEGLDAEVEHWTSSHGMEDTFKITKEINGEPFSQTVSYDAARHKPDELRQQIAYDAANIARNFDELLTERVEWGESCVLFDMKDGHSATCFRCGAEVNVSDFPSRSLRMSETAVPQPPCDIIDGLSDTKIKMTLQALLKDECDVMCPNSPKDGVYQKT